MLVFLGTRWKKMDESEKKLYEEKANELKEEHQRKYPHYKYRPRRRNNQSRDKSSFAFSKNYQLPKLGNVKTSPFPTKIVTQSNVVDESNSRNSSNTFPESKHDTYQTNGLSNFSRQENESKLLTIEDETNPITNKSSETISLRSLSSSFSGAEKKASSIFNTFADVNSRETTRKVSKVGNKANRSPANFSKDTVSKILDFNKDPDQSVATGFEITQSSSFAPCFNWHGYNIE